MQRVIGHYLTREMAFLGVIEASLSFAAIYAVARLPDASGGRSTGVDSLLHDSLALASVLTLITGAASLATGLYNPNVSLDLRRLLITGGSAAALTFPILLVTSRAGARDEPFTTDVWFLTKLLGVWLVTLTVIRLVYAVRALRAARVRRILLIGGTTQIDPLSGRLGSLNGRRFEPVALDAFDLSWSALRRDRIWGVIVAEEPKGLMLRRLLDCKLRGIRIVSAAAFQERYLGRLDLDTLTAQDLLVMQGFTNHSLALAVKRSVDIVVGLSLLVGTLPLMFLTMLAIKFDSPGPIFYRQKRLGQYDEPFTLFKFRSMARDAEPGGSPRWAQRRDPRITRVGRLIRATRIDELPQLINVLRGEMSLVGPRPERPHFVEQLAKAIPFYRQRSYVKPGVTGWAQINFPYGASISDAREKLAYDLYYIKYRSLLLDAAILVSTIRVVFSRDGAR